MTLEALSALATQLAPILECVAYACAGFALIKWMWERADRASDVVLNLEKEFHDKCTGGRPLLEDPDKYRTVAQMLEEGASAVKSVGKKISRQMEIDDLLRFYVVLFAVRQQRQVNDASLSTCYRYWLAHYYRKDRKEFRRYINALFPTLREWLLTDTRASKRLKRRWFSKWWRPFFRPGDFWPPEAIIQDPDELFPKERDVKG